MILLFIDGEIILGGRNQGDGILNKYSAFLFLLLYNSVNNQMVGVNNIYRSSMPGALQVVVGSSSFSFQLWWEVPSCFCLV